MLTQQLNRYTWKPNQPVYQVYQGPASRAAMDKLTYALFLNTLPFKKGDLVVHKDASHRGPYNIYMIQLVHEITEVHHQVSDWGTTMVGPRCVWMWQPWRKGYHYDPRPFLTTSDYRPVQYDELPDEVKAYVDARTGQVPETD